VTPEQAERYIVLRRASANASAAFIAFRVGLAADCDHPAQFVYDIQWEHDNGYGVQKMLPGKWCEVCNATQFWPGMSESWTSAKDVAAHREGT
jgi:hypothetical protein